MKISDKHIAELKEIYRKERGKELTDLEAQDIGQRLASFVEVLMDTSLKEVKRKRRLKDEPKGFHLDQSDGTYTFRICSDSISGDQTWWDLNGIKCMNCQRAIDKKIIPRTVCKSRDSWLAGWQLKDKFGIHPSSIKKLIRLGKLKPRNILDENGGIHQQIFLITENSNFLGSLSNDNYR